MLYCILKAVHGGGWRQDVPVQDAVPVGTKTLDLGYASATKAMDDAIGNITDVLKSLGM